MDRCALFVDAGYMLADGAMAVHGTRRRESVTWDYEGLLELLAHLARDRTGLPLLRCYWYEATVEGRRTAEHDALADMPGIKLRLAKLRPGRREGVETEIHRDLTVLARNGVSDAVVVSAEEDLAQVVSDVQDLGMRVTIVHVTVDGNWTISRSLRQECDDIMELTSAHLRPYVDLIPGAEPAGPDEQYQGGALSARSASNGHSAAGAGSYQALTAGSGHSGPPSIYTAPVVAEYQRPPQQIAPYQQEEPEPPVREEPAAPSGPPLVFGRSEAPSPSAPERPEPVRGEPMHGEPLPSTGMRTDGFDRPDFDTRGTGRPGRGRGERGRGEPGLPAAPASPGRGESSDGEPAPRQDLYAAPVSMPFRGPSPAQPPVADDPSARAEPGSHARPHQQGEPPAQGQGTQGPGPQSPAGRGRPASADYPPRMRGGEDPSAFGQAGAQDQFRGEAPDPHRGTMPPGQFRRAPAAPSGPPAGPPGAQGPLPGRPAVHGAPGSQGPVHGAPAPAPQGSPPYVPPQNGPYSGPQPTAMPGRQPSSAPVSLTDAVQSAHEEGKEFGESVAREAPALWLEAVLARKPRMPSDLEARLLQGSALPIDFLLHDEVRHALRRGFWDALEGSRH